MDLSEPRIFYFSFKLLINEELVKNWRQILQRVKIPDPNSSKKSMDCHTGTRVFPARGASKVCSQIFSLSQIQVGIQEEKKGLQGNGKSGKNGKLQEEEKFLSPQNELQEK